MSYSFDMKKLSTKWFAKWARKSGLKNENMLEAIENLENSLSTANLGSCLYKVRVNRPHSGKSSGFRTIIVYKKNDKAIFLYGFGKNEKGNISQTELQYFKKLGKDLMSLNTEQLEKSIEQQILFELEVDK